MSRPDYQTLIESLREHQLKGPIIKCRLEWLPNKPVMIINGQKRAFLCGAFGIPIIEEVLVAETEADYLRYLKQFKEPWLTTKSKKAWLNLYAESLYNANIKPGQIAQTVAMLSGVNVRTARRWLHDRYKDRHQQARATGGQSVRQASRQLLIKFRKDFDFLYLQHSSLVQSLYKKAGKDFIDLCYTIKGHFGRQRSIEAYTKH